ncbi:MAG: peroxidase [Moorea sp. SIO2I5]|nr:peroxidase [Moorena sp. SIO2I5]
MSELTPEAREDIQGIILSGYGHLRYALFLFVQIKNPKQAQAWLKTILPEITTGKLWPKRPDGTTEKPESTLNIAFTHKGLQALNLPQHTLETFSRELIEGIATSKRSRILGDTAESAPDQWDVGGANNEEINMLLILYGLDPESLAQRRNQLLQDQDDSLVVVAEEPGFRAPSNKEHFGFNDSISQPIIEGNRNNQNPNQDVVKTGEFILGYPNQYDFLPATPSVPVDQDSDNILPSFPGTELSELKDFGRHGTYLVYRKLAQDVAGFWQYIAQQGHDGEGCPHAPTMNLLAAKLVGRWPSGTPLVLAPDQDNPEIHDKNQFKYLPEDKEGYRCPIGAHIRRSNPRDSFLDATPEDSFKLSNRHRIIRRGAIYGEPLFPIGDIENGQLPVDIQDDGKPRGLHFFSINANIRRQFEFLQETWCNNPRFNSLYDNKDPIIGDNDGSGHMTIQRSLIRKRINNLPRFVTVKGGGYFFMPSITAMQFMVNCG